MRPGDVVDLELTSDERDLQEGAQAVRGPLPHGGGAGPRVVRWGGPGPVAGAGRRRGVHAAAARVGRWRGARNAGGRARLRGAGAGARAGAAGWPPRWPPGWSTARWSARSSGTGAWSSGWPRSTRWWCATARGCGAVGPDGGGRGGGLAARPADPGHPGGVAAAGRAGGRPGGGGQLAGGGGGADGGPAAGLRRGHARRGGGLRQGAHAVRPAHRDLPGDQAPSPTCSCGWRWPGRRCGRRAPPSTSRT